ncbi:hypothetical protein JVU11DRAFT_9315 [Chiua virens]|nr:hypothetical protein JVU11DRAFT_9315 [Chiua virens]
MQQSLPSSVALYVGMPVILRLRNLSTDLGITNGSQGILSDLPPKYFVVTPKVRIERLQLPIQPAFAVTGHSAQGKTLPKIMVDLSEGGFAAYVAASRARTREEVRRFEALQHNTKQWVTKNEPET